MRLLYYRDPIGNFGDDLNLWLWPRILPKPLAECFDEQTLFIGIGTLLSKHHIPPQPPKKVVFGAGAGYGPPPDIDKNWQILCVRGRLTAAALGLPGSVAVSDPAVLAGKLMTPPDRPRYAVSFMPHHKTAGQGDWRAVCEAASIHYLDPSAPVEMTLDAIAASGLLITESMHGAIVADTFRVPHIPVRTAAYILEFKWRDWAETVGIDHSFEALPSLADKAVPCTSSMIDEVRQRLLWLIRHGHRRLSPEQKFRVICERMDDALTMLKASV